MVTYIFYCINFGVKIILLKLKKIFFITFFETLLGREHSGKVSKKNCSAIIISEESSKNFGGNYKNLYLEKMWSQHKNGLPDLNKLFTQKSSLLQNH